MQVNRILPLIAVTGLMVAGIAVTGEAKAPERICGQKYVKLVAHKYGAYVYVTRTSKLTGFQTKLCDRGRREALDSGSGPGSRVQYRSVTITPSRIGLAVQNCIEMCQTTVTQGSRTDETDSLFGVDPAVGLTEVSRLRVGYNGEIAWISCSGTTGSEPTALLSRGCRRSKKRIRKVYVLPPNPVPDPNEGGPRRPPTLLASGRGIDPFSLAVGQERVTWRHNGRLRSAPIPPPRDPPPA